MSDRVTEIEQGALTVSVLFVVRDNSRFDFNVSLNQWCEIDLARVDPVIVKELTEHLRVGDDCVLNDFREALNRCAQWQRFQNVDVIDDERWLMNCADQVFSRARVHAGFSANRAVHHRQKRSRNLHVRNAALKNCRYKSGKIANHAAAEPDDERLSIQIGAKHLLTAISGLFERL